MNKRKIENSLSSSNDEEDSFLPENEEQPHSHREQTIQKRFSHRFVNVPLQQQRSKDVIEDTPDVHPNHRITVTTRASRDEPLTTNEDSDSWDGDDSSYSSYYSQPMYKGNDMTHVVPAKGGVNGNVEFQPFSVEESNKKFEDESNFFGTNSWMKPIEGGILKNATTRLVNGQTGAPIEKFDDLKVKSSRTLKQDALTKARRSARLPRSQDTTERGNNPNLVGHHVFGDPFIEMDTSTIQAAEARRNRLASNRHKEKSRSSTPILEARSMRKARLQQWR